MMLMDQPTKDKMAALKARVAALEKPKSSTSPDLSRDELAHFTFDELKGNKLADSLHAAPPPQPKKDAKDKGPPDPAAVLKGENKLVPGKIGNAIQFTGDDAVDTPLGNFQRHEPFSVSLWMQTPDVKDRAVVFHRSQAWTDAASRGYELLIEEGKLKWSLIHFWPGNAISIRMKENIPLKQWLQVIVTYDGSSRADGLKILVDGKQAAVDVIKDNLTKTIAGGGHDNISLGERMRDRGFKGGLIDDFRVFGRDVTTETNADLQKARAELFAFQDAQKELMVMKELPQPKKAYVLTRGEYDKRGEEVGPATPASLSAVSQECAEESPRLRAMAHRAGSSAHGTSHGEPSVAELVWSRTGEDHGGLRQPGRAAVVSRVARLPLAMKFIQSGWDVKALVKEIVTSQVYRQNSIADAKTMADDPENQWLARGPRFRLPAEMIRDNALATAGLIKLTLGGPPVHPMRCPRPSSPSPLAQATRSIAAASTPTGAARARRLRWWRLMRHDVRCAFPDASAPIHRSRRSFCSMACSMSKPHACSARSCISKRRAICPR
jgi:hypothetical protein